MNKKGRTAYTRSNRQDKKKRGSKDMTVANLIHDEIYTFKNEFYDTLQSEFLADILKDIEEDEE